MIPPKPRKLEDFKAGERLFVGMGESVIYPDLDLETYSEAGFSWNNVAQKWVKPPGLSKKGLPGIGTPAYAEHPTCDVLCLAYDLKEGEGRRLWIPSAPMLPDDLLDHIRSGGIIEAWNAPFEVWVWNFVLVRKYHFPPLQLTQVRDAAAKARAYGLPSSLKNAAQALRTTAQKDKEGMRLINKFSIPRNPTKTNSALRTFPVPADPDTALLYSYNRQDIATEAEISARVPELNEFELEFWQCDLRINQRGVAIDKRSVENCIKIVEAAHRKYNAKLSQLTDGQCKSSGEIQRIVKWLASELVHVSDLTADTVDDLLSNDQLPDNVLQVLQIRKALSSAAVKKLYSMKYQATSDERLHDLFSYHAARTGRFAGVGAQPQNLPRDGLNVKCCEGCGRHFSLNLSECPWGKHNFTTKIKWNSNAAVDALEVINAGSLKLLEYYFGDAIGAISGCLRSLFISAAGKDLICSDYKSIEAIVLAMLAGEEWRIEVFRSHGYIYEMSASKITGIPFDDYITHKARTGEEHHPTRNKVGKVAELAGGFGGGVGAYKRFGAEGFIGSDAEIQRVVYAWREASPAIVEFWGGQQRRSARYHYTKEYYGLEGSAILAVLHPGLEFSHRMITYIKRGDVLFCRLPSGRYICYHEPRLEPSEKFPSLFQLSFMGWNTNPEMGSIGWVRMRTYGAKLTENVVQAVARDILAHAIVNLEKAGYSVVLHVHDEIVAEIDEGFGSVEEFEEIMSTAPAWANDWPIRVAGGWRGKRYKK